MNNIEIYILLLAGILYFTRILIYSVGSKRERRYSYPNEDKISKEFISVIIPARNEENNIKRCVESLLDSDYPNDKYEIIIVNDRSEDNTLNILKEYEEHIKIINIIEKNPHQNLQGKVGAIQAGIENSKGELLLFTDADCRVHKKWIETISKLFNEYGVDFIASFALIESDSIFGKIQGVEWVMTNTMAAGEVGVGSPYGCYGNNISYRKSAYEKIGGYKNIKFSVTEDLALLQAMNNNNKRVKYICNPEAVVYTLPEKSIKDLLNQQKRWILGGLALKLKATFYVLTSISIWLSIFVNLFFGNYYLVGLTVFIKLLGDLIVLLPSLKQLNLKKYYIYTVPALFLFIFFEIVIPFLMINHKVKWKGQEFKA